MRSRIGVVARRLTTASGLVTGLLLLGGRGVVAQGVDGDARWQAWIGCWEPVAPDSMPSSAARSPRVCVTPAGGTSAVEIATVIGDSVVAKQLVDASGVERPVNSQGCTGWERATWSANAQRVYLSSSSTCSGGLVRRTNGVFLLAGNGQWIDVEGVAAGTAVGVRVTRYRDVTSAGGLPPKITAALRGRDSRVNAARIAAMAPFTTADVIEASHSLDTGVLETMLVERRDGFALDARTLVELDKAGVPPTVIDVMVALTYPQVFALDGSRVTGSTVADAEALDQGRRIYAGTMYDPNYGYGYGYGPYGYGYGGYYSGWYPGRRPIIVVRQPSDGTTEAERHGQVVKGKGYTADGTRSGDTGGSATTSGKSGSSGSSGKASSGSSDKKSSGSGSGRTAKPRKPE